MKKNITLWLAMMALGLCLGCSDPVHKFRHKFRVGQIVDLKIGGQGQITAVNPNWMELNYRVRVNTENGPKYFSFSEFELKFQPWLPS